MTTETQRLVCVECGAVFGLTARQDLWLRRRVEAKGGVYSAPHRCPGCLARRFLVEHEGFVLEHCGDCGEPFAEPQAAEVSAQPEGEQAE